MKKYIIGLVSILLLAGCNNETTFGNPKYYKNYDYRQELSEDQSKNYIDLIQNNVDGNFISKKHIYVDSYSKAGNRKERIQSNTDINIYDDDNSNAGFVIKRETNKNSVIKDINGGKETNTTSSSMTWLSPNGYMLDVTTDVDKLGYKDTQYNAKEVHFNLNNKIGYIKKEAAYHTFDVTSGKFYYAHDNHVAYLFNDTWDFRSKVDNAKTIEMAYKTQEFLLLNKYQQVEYYYKYYERKSNYDSELDGILKDKVLDEYTYIEVKYEYDTRKTLSINSINKEYQDINFPVYRAAKMIETSCRQVGDTYELYYDALVGVGSDESTFVDRYNAASIYENEVGIWALGTQPHISAYKIQIEAGYVTPNRTYNYPETRLFDIDMSEFLGRYSDFVFLNTEYGPYFVNTNSEKDYRFIIRFKMSENETKASVISVHEVR